MTRFWPTTCILLALSGCQTLPLQTSSGIALRSAAPREFSASPVNFRLAAQQQRQQPPEPAPTIPEAADAPQPTTAAAQQQPPVASAQPPQPYTAPSPEFRNIGTAVMVSALAVAPAMDDAAGRERVESLVFSAMGPAGRLGATAPPTVVAGAVQGRPGIGEGQGTALGFGSPTTNVFEPRVNRFSGPGGGRSQLHDAGFGAAINPTRRSVGRK